MSGQAQHPCETLMDQRPSIAAPASSPHSLFPPSPWLLLQLGCIPQSPVALFWDVTIPLKTSLANEVLLFLLSLPFLGDHSSSHLENHPLVNKAQIIWPCQSKQLHALAVSEIPLDPDVHVWRCFPGSTKPRAFGPMLKRAGLAWLLRSSIPGGRQVAEEQEKMLCQLKFEEG